MHIFTLPFVLWLLPAVVSASPLRSLETRQNNNDTGDSPYSIPQDSPSPLRAAGVSTKQKDFTYGPGIGGGPFSPAGPLGIAAIKRDTAIYQKEGGNQLQLTQAENASAAAAVDQVSSSSLFQQSECRRRRRRRRADHNAVQWPQDLGRLCQAV